MWLVKSRGICAFFVFFMDYLLIFENKKTTMPAHIRNLYNFGLNT